MCLKCHSGLSDDVIIKQLTEAIQNPNFDAWNTTSLHHVYLAIYGLNGGHAHELGLQLAEQFYQWYLGSTNGYWQWFTGYMPKNGFEEFGHSSKIRQNIDKAKEFYKKNKDKTKHEIFELITTEDEVIVVPLDAIRTVIHRSASNNHHFLNSIPVTSNYMFEVTLFGGKRVSKKLAGHRRSSTKIKDHLALPNAPSFCQLGLNKAQVRWLQGLDTEGIIEFPKGDMEVSKGL